MTRFVALAALLGSAALAPADDKPVGDISPLVGEWQFVSLTVKGKATDAAEVKNYRMVVSKDGRVAVFDGKNQVVAGRIKKVDSDKKPPQIDMVVAGRSEFSGKFEPEGTQEGVFEVGKDKMKICRTRDARDGPRPTEFASPKDKDLVLEEFERIK